MNTFTAIALLAFVAVCFAGGNPGLNNGPEKNTGEPGVVITCPDCPPMPDADPNCEIKGNDQRGSQHNTAKVWICHGTASETNPYVLINVDDASLWQGHFDGGAPGHGKKNHPDIWPNSVGYDGLVYDCNCERVLPPAPPPAPDAPPPPPAPEVFTVSVGTPTIDSTCTAVSESIGACEDEAIRVQIVPIIVTIDRAAVTSCEVVVTNLPESSYIVNSNGTCGHPSSDSSSSWWTLSCDEAKSVYVVLPPNWDTSFSSRITVTATKPSLADPTFILTATDYKTETFKIQPINDPPVVGVLIGGIFDSAPAFNIENVWGYKTVLPQLRMQDVDLLPVQPVMVRIVVTHGVLGFDTDTELVLEHPASSTTDAFWAPVTIEARPIETLLNTFSEVTFRCVPTTTQDSSLIVCSEILNSLHYLAPVAFSGFANVRITVDDIGSSGACVLPGPARWSECTSDHIDIPIEVVCERMAPLRVDAGEENVYANPGVNIDRNTPTIYMTRGDLGDKIAICHATSSFTVNPYNFIVPDDSSFMGHFLSRSGWCRNDGSSYGSLDDVRDEFSCCANSVSQAFSTTDKKYGDIMAYCTARVFDDCSNYLNDPIRVNNGPSPELYQCCLDVTGKTCTYTGDKRVSTGGNHGVDLFMGEAYRGGNPNNPDTYVIGDSPALCPYGLTNDGEFCTAQPTCSCELVNRNQTSHKLVLALNADGLVVIGNFVAGAGSVISDSETAESAGAATDASNSADDGSSTMWSLVAAALSVAVVGLIVAFVLVRRRRTQKENSVEEAAPADVAPRRPAAWVSDQEGSVYALAAAIEAIGSDVDDDGDESASLVNGA